MWSTVRSEPPLLLKYFQCFGQHFGCHLQVDEPFNANKIPEGRLKYVGGSRLGRQDFYVD